MAEALQIWFIALWSLGIVGFIGSIIRFRKYRTQVEKQIGPLPTPLGILNFIVLGILFAQVGQISAANSDGWMLVRIAGVALSIYAIVMLPWALRTLGDFALPGAAVLHDHELVTSGPFRLVRHPLTSALLALWLGTALGTLNWLLAALWPLLLVGAYVGGRAEEQLLTDKFGTTYESYASATRRFIPAPRLAQPNHPTPSPETRRNRGA